MVVAVAVAVAVAVLVVVLVVVDDDVSTFFWLLLQLLFMGHGSNV